MVGLGGDSVVGCGHVEWLTRPMSVLLYCRSVGGERAQDLWNLEIAYLKYEEHTFCEISKNCVNKRGKRS